MTTPDAKMTSDAVGSDSDIGARLEKTCIDGEDDCAESEAEDTPDKDNSKISDDDFIDEVYLKDLDVDCTSEQLEERKNKAISFKEEGNMLFKENNFALARSKYTAALRTCPLTYSEERAVFFANRAASSKKEGRMKEALEDCGHALELNPTYMKALKRRAAWSEEDEKFDESLEDYKKILEINPRDVDALQAIQRLPSKIQERNEKLKEQMLGTLKDLGNKILRPFGLSTNNFQLQQDPASGGYTINFNQNSQ